VPRELLRTPGIRTLAARRRTDLIILDSTVAVNIILRTLLYCDAWIYDSLAPCDSRAIKLPGPLTILFGPVGAPLGSAFLSR